MIQMKCKRKKNMMTATAVISLNLPIIKLKTHRGRGNWKKRWLIQGRCKSVMNKITKLISSFGALVECVMSLMCASAASICYELSSRDSVYLYTFLSVNNHRNRTNALFNCEIHFENRWIWRRLNDRLRDRWPVYKQNMLSFYLNSNGNRATKRVISMPTSIRIKYRFSWVFASHSL